MRSMNFHAQRAFDQWKPPSPPARRCAIGLFAIVKVDANGQHAFQLSNTGIGGWTWHLPRFDRPRSLAGHVGAESRQMVVDQVIRFLLPENSGQNRTSILPEVSYMVETFAARYFD